MFWKKKRKRKKPDSATKKLVGELGIVKSIRLGCGVIWLGALLVFAALTADLLGKSDHSAISNPYVVHYALMAASGGIILLPLLWKFFVWWVDRPKKS